MHVLLTGASGYIGSRLAATLAGQRASVTVLGAVSSELAASAKLLVLSWRLGQPVPDEAFDPERPPVDAVIHLAHDWNTVEGEHEPNREGTALLLAAARANRVRRFVFVSSMSARPDAPNRYGRIKASTERLLKSPQDVAARLGLVYGGAARGLYGTMIRLTGLSPVLPMIDAGQLVQPIHIDEACSGLITLASRPELAKPIYCLASNRPVTFGAFLKLLARVRHGRRLLLIPIPRQIALWAADISARLPFIPVVDRERVLGLAGIRVRDTSDDLKDLGLNLRQVADGLAAPHDRERQLVKEGFALLRYCAGAPIKGETVRLYVRALQRLGQAEPLDLSRWTLRCPALLRLRDAAQQPNSRLRTRLGIAARIAEAGPEPAARFHMTQAERRIVVVMRLVGLAIVEGALFAIRLFSRLVSRT